MSGWWSSNDADGNFNSKLQNDKKVGSWEQWNQEMISQLL